MQSTMMMDSALAGQMLALAQILLIDVALAGDNAVVVGMAVAGLKPAQQRPAILGGIAGAALIRILLALVAMRLLVVVGLTLAGGLLLLGVCWRMAQELRRDLHPDAAGAAGKTLRQAMLQIILADISMSLDNVLAVAGAARGHIAILVIGLILSVALMGLAAGLIARLLTRFRVIAWAGLLMILYVALRMIWDGTHQVAASWA
jgi:YjbE family integral membrane protein